MLTTIGNFVGAGIKTIPVRGPRVSKIKFCKYGISGMTSCRVLSTSTPSNRKFVQPTRGNMTEDPEVGDIVKSLRNEPNVMRKLYHGGTRELRKFYEEKCETFLFNEKFVKRDYHDEMIDIVFKFEEDKDLDNFMVTTDSTENGFSSGTLKISENKTAIFSGYIDTTVPEGEEKIYSGFANMSTFRKTKSFNRPSYYNWLDYTHVVLKIRGDGRAWAIVLSTPSRYNHTWSYQYVHPLYTRGGPYWQITKIPFSHFFHCESTCISKFRSATVPQNRIARFGLTLADNINGPFKLEIDYIGLETIKNTATGISPYEMYHTDFDLFRE